MKRWHGPSMPVGRVSFYKSICKQEIREVSPRFDAVNFLMRVMIEK